MSPIEHLSCHLIQSLAKVAPEKAAELQELLDKHHIRFILDKQSPYMVFAACHQTKTITVGLLALERLWARAFAYVSLYDFLTNRLPGNPKPLDIKLDDPEIKPAMELLAWAVEVERRLVEGGVGDLPWPADLPRPCRDAGRGSFENAADELMLCTIASILHHEVGHIERNHHPQTLPRPASKSELKDDQNIQIAEVAQLLWEKEADAWSANWLLEGLDEKDDRFLKRALGIALGYLWIASRDIHTGCVVRAHHPPAWDRLYQNIKQHIPNSPSHPIWMFVAYVLLLHLTSIEEVPPDAEYQTPEDLVNQLLDHVSRLNDRPK